MRQRREIFSHFIEIIQIDIRNGDRLHTRCACHHRSPWIDDHAVSVTFPVYRVRTDLSSRYHIAQIFDGSGANQYFPVRQTGMQCESGRYGNNLAATIGKGAIKLGKSQIRSVPRLCSKPRYMRADEAREVESSLRAALKKPKKSPRK